MSTPIRQLGDLSQLGRSLATGTFSLTFASLVILALAVSACSSGPTVQAGHRTSIAAATATQAIPTGWQLYRDPGGYFTIAVPAGWRIDTSAGTGNINAAQVKTYQTGFLSPGAGDSPAGVFTGLRVSVSYDIYVTAPYSGEYLKQTVCGIAKQANTTLAGLPAEYMRMQGNESSWIVGTSAAPYTISSVLPDTPDGTLRDGSPTPLPESTVQAAQGEANAIVASFRPIPATAPQC